MSGNVMYGQSENYKFFMNAGKNVVEQLTNRSVPTDVMKSGAELAKACAMLAEACKERA